MFKLLKICIIALACPFLIPMVMEDSEEDGKADGRND